MVMFENVIMTGGYYIAVLLEALIARFVAGKLRRLRWSSDIY